MANAREVFRAGRIIVKSPGVAQAAGGVVLLVGMFDGTMTARDAADKLTAQVFGETPPPHAQVIAAKTAVAAYDALNHDSIRQGIFALPSLDEQQRLTQAQGTIFTAESRRNYRVSLMGDRTPETVEAVGYDLNRSFYEMAGGAALLAIGLVRQFAPRIGLPPFLLRFRGRAK